jgi:hypothetical protein
LRSAGGAAKEIQKAIVSLELAREQRRILDEESRTFELTANLPLHKLGTKDTPSKPGCVITQPVGVTPPPRCYLRNSATLVVSIPASYTPGDYKMRVNVVHTKGKEKADGTPSIQFVIE